MARVIEIKIKKAITINYTHVKFICDNLKDNQKILYPNTNSGYGIGENGECTEENHLTPYHIMELPK